MERMMVTHVQRMQADYRSFYAGHALCHGEQLDPSAMRQGKHIAALCRCMVALLVPHALPPGGETLREPIGRE
eukprot:1449028-Ditylum_brightwellii.AAC.1